MPLHQTTKRRGNITSSGNIVNIHNNELKQIELQEIRQTDDKY